MSSSEDPSESDDDVEEVNKRRKKRANLTGYLLGRISLMSLIFWRNFCLSGRQRTEAPSAATAPKSIREASYRRSYADSFTLATCFYPCLSGRSRWRFYGFPRHRLTIPPAEFDPSRLPWRFFMCMGYSKQRLAFYSEVSSLHRGAMSDGLYRQPMPV
jgi:hypothetical protein